MEQTAISTVDRFLNGVYHSPIGLSFYQIVQIVSTGKFYSIDGCWYRSLFEKSSWRIVAGQDAPPTGLVFVIGRARDFPPTGLVFGVALR